MLPMRRAAFSLVINELFILNYLLAVPLLNLFICCFCTDRSTRLLAYPSAQQPMYLSTYP